MPYMKTDDGIRLYIEDIGSGQPILFIHEFGGTHQSWRAQVRFFSRRYRCVTYAARGYAPSDVPDDPSAYSQERAVGDAVAVLNHLGLGPVHVVGLSMGAFCALHLGLTHPESVSALVLGSIGYGSAPATRARFLQECASLADAFESEPLDKVADRFNRGAARIQLLQKDPRTWEDVKADMVARSPRSAASIIRGIQMARQSFYEFPDRLTSLAVPTLVMAGDQDWGCVEPSLFLRDHLSGSGLCIFPQTGHTINLEEPDLFNQMVSAFLSAVEHDSWPVSLAGTNSTFMWD